MNPLTKFRINSVLHFSDKIEASYPRVPGFSGFDIESLFKFYFAKKFLLLDPKVFRPLFPSELNKIFQKASSATTGEHKKYFTLFDPDFYLLANPDIDATNLSPWLHFIRYGRKENRLFNIYIDPQFVRAQLSPEKEFDLIFDYLLEENLWQAVPSKSVRLETFHKFIKHTKKALFPCELVGELFELGAYDFNKFIINQLSLENNKEQFAAYSILKSKLKPLGTEFKIFYSPKFENFQIDFFINQEVRVVPQCSIFSNSGSLVLPEAKFDETLSSIVMSSGVYFERPIEPSEEVTLIELSEYATLDTIESLISSKAEKSKIAILPNSIQQEFQLEELQKTIHWPNTKLLRFRHSYDLKLTDVISTPQLPIRFNKFSDYVHQPERVLLILAKEEALLSKLNVLLFQKEIKNKVIFMNNSNLIRQFLLMHRDSCDVVLKEDAVHLFSLYLSESQTYIFDESFYDNQ